MAANLPTKSTRRTSKLKIGITSWKERFHVNIYNGGLGQCIPLGNGARKNFFLYLVWQNVSVIVIEWFEWSSGFHRVSTDSWKAVDLVREMENEILYDQTVYTSSAVHAFHNHSLKTTVAKTSPNNWKAWKCLELIPIQPKRSQGRQKMQIVRSFEKRLFYPSH